MKKILIVGIIIGIIIVSLFFLLKPAQRIEDFDSLELGEINQFALADGDLMNHTGSEGGTILVDGNGMSLTRWNGDAGINIPFIDALTTDVEVGGNVTIETNRGTLVVYLVNDNTYEFDLILQSRPGPNSVQFPIEYWNLTFSYQEMLMEDYDGCVWNNETDCLDGEGNNLAHMPLNVVGSYAIYFDGYRNGFGKFAHLYRPLVTDANGDTTWGILEVTDNTMSIEIDRIWLRDAVYPVKIDPAFGMTSTPGSDIGYFAVAASPRANILDNYTASAGDTITELHVFAFGYGVQIDASINVYNVSDPYPDTRLGPLTTISFSNSAPLAIAEVTGLSWELTAGDVYIVATGNASGNSRIGYDLMAGGNWYSDHNANGDLPVDWAHGSTNRARYGIYANYTEGGAGDTCSPTSPLVANHLYDCTDNCEITSNVNANGFNVTMSGAGIFIFNANITNYSVANVIDGCVVTCSDGCFNELDS